jgi:hypothetical protein
VQRDVDSLSCFCISHSYYIRYMMLLFMMLARKIKLCIKTLHYRNTDFTFNANLQLSSNHLTGYYAKVCVSVCNHHVGRYNVVRQAMILRQSMYVCQKQHPKYDHSMQSPGQVSHKELIHISSWTQHKSR